MTATTLPNSGIKYKWASGEDGWGTGMDENLLMIDTLMSKGVISMALTTPPVSPTSGDRYIPLATATGAWAGLENKIVVYANSAWAAYTPKNGWVVYDANTDAYYKYNGSSWVSDPFGDRAYATNATQTYAASAVSIYDFDREDLSTSSSNFRQTNGSSVVPITSEVNGITGYKTMAGWVVLKLNSTTNGASTDCYRYTGSYLSKGVCWHTGDTLQYIYRLALRDLLPTGSDDFEYRIGVCHLGLGSFAGDWFSTSPPDTADGAAAYFLVDKNSGYFQCKSGWTTSLQTTITSVTAALNQLYTFKIKINSSGNVLFYIDGVLVATHSATGVIPDEKCMGEVVAIINNAPTASAVKAVVLDLIGYKHAPASSRTALAFD